MVILVTGGAGFIGSHLVDALLAQNHTVLCVDNLSTGNEKNIDHLKSNKLFTLYNHDITKPFSYDGPIDAIFHMASPASPNSKSPISYHALAYETMMANTIGTNLLLQLAQKKKSCFLFASTSEVYGDPLEHPQKESYLGNVSTTGPRSVYDEAKRFGETITAYYGRQGVDVRIVRIFNTYGPRMQKGDMRMIVSFINQALSNVPITVFGDGTQTRSLCYVDDLVQGLIRLMFNEHTTNQIVNLGSPEEHTVNEYAMMICKLTGSKSIIEHTEQLPEDDPKKRKPDISKAKELLQWEPKVSLENGIKNVINYYKNNQ